MFSRGLLKKVQPVGASETNAEAYFGTPHKCVTGMTMRPEVKILTQGPNGGNLTPKTQVRWGGALPLTAVRLGPVRERVKEAIGATRFRAEAKRREASPEGKSAFSDEAQYPWVRAGVGATRWGRRLVFLPSEICRDPLLGGRPKNART